MSVGPTLASWRNERGSSVRPGEVSMDGLSLPVLPQCRSTLLNGDISVISQLENLKVSSFSKFLSRDRERGLHTKKELLLPRGCDFKKLLDEIDKVIGGSQREKLAVLQENVKEDLSVDEGKMCFMKIKCKGRSLPLVIRIFDREGRLVCYVSKLNHYPNKDNCDFIFKNDRFSAPDGFGLFTFEWIYIGIFAVTKADFSIIAGFRRQLNLKRFDSPKLPVISTKSTAKAQSGKIQFSKNFVEINKKSTSPSSLSKLSNWNEKKEAVLYRRNQLLNEKKRKVALYLNKKAMLQEENVRQKIVFKEMENET